MADLSNTVATDFAWYYEFVAAHLHKWVDPLTQEQFWRNPFNYGNSVGHLTLHLTGNLNYYIGARVAKTGYVRDRNREFTETEKPDKAKVLEAFDQTIAMVVSAVRKQKPEDWMAPYSAELEPEAAERFMIFLRCAGHAYHHVGQIILLTKELARQTDPQSASA
jgi:uncharacterized damage-inducible protein DinB